MLRTCHALGLVLALIAPVIATAQSRWPDERQVGPFLCHADFSLASEESLVEEMAVLQDDLTGILGARKSRGAVHVFLRTGTTWEWDGLLPIPPLGPGFDNVGASVSVRGEVLAVGSPSEDPSREFVLLYRRVDGVWTFERAVQSFFAPCLEGDESCWVETFLSQYGAQAPGCPFGTTADADGDCDVDFRDLAIFLALGDPLREALVEHHHVDHPV